MHARIPRIFPPPTRSPSPRSQHHRSAIDTLIIGTMIMQLLGCAEAPVAHQREVGHCSSGVQMACTNPAIVLDESIRTVAVIAGSTWIEFILDDPEPMGKPVVARAGNALLGATKGLFGCIVQGGYGGPIGIAIGVILSPACAIAGGIDGARDQTAVRLGRDVSEIFGKSLEGSAIQAWIREDILRASEARNGHPLTFVPALEPAAGASASDSLLPSFLTPNAKLIVTIKRVMLYDASKSRDADPARPLVVEAEAVLHSAQSDEHIASIQVVHHGEQHPLSRWLADDAAQLKESLRSASRILGERIYGQIGHRSSKQ